MSNKKPVIFNSANYQTSALTVQQANKLYYQKGQANLNVTGNETVQNETVYGNLNTNTLNASGSVTLGSTNSNHVINGNVSISALPITTTDLSTSITNNNSLVTKKYVDNSVSNTSLLSSANTFTGINTFSNDLIRQNSFSATANNFNFSCQPQVSLTSYQTTSGSSANTLTTKSYVDNSISAVLPIKSDTIIYGQQAYLTQSGSNYILTSPNLGTSTTSNTTGFNIDFYLNFPATSNNGVITPFTNCATFEFNYYQYQPATVNLVSGFVSSTGNTATFNRQIASSEIGSQVGIFGFTTINAVFNLAIKNGNVLVYAPIQTKAIWTNPTTTNGAQSGVQFTNNYGSNANLMKYYPIFFTYVNDSKIKISVQFPNQQNNPGTSYWVSNLGFSAKINNSNIMNSSNFVNGLSTLPSTNSNTNSGGAFFSVS